MTIHAPSFDYEATRGVMRWTVRMKENPGSTQKDALHHINGMIEAMIKK